MGRIARLKLSEHGTRGTTLLRQSRDYTKQSLKNRFRVDDDHSQAILILPLQKLVASILTGVGRLFILDTEGISFVTLSKIHLHFSCCMSYGLDGLNG